MRDEKAPDLSGRGHDPAGDAPPDKERIIQRFIESYNRYGHGMDVKRYASAWWESWQLWDIFPTHEEFSYAAWRFMNPEAPSAKTNTNNQQLSLL
jgi:hypothetical protein